MQQVVVNKVTKLQLERFIELKNLGLCFSRSQFLSRYKLGAKNGSGNTILKEAQDLGLLSVEKRLKPIAARGIKFISMYTVKPTVDELHACIHWLSNSYSGDWPVFVPCRVVRTADKKRRESPLVEFDVMPAAMRSRQILRAAQQYGAHNAFA